VNKKKLDRLKNALLQGDFGEVFKGGGIAFVYRVCSMTLSYGIIIYISKTLGEVGLGIYNLCLAILGILIMVGCLGFNTSVVRFVSQYVSKGWGHSVKELYQNTARRTTVLSIILAVLMFFSSEYLALEVYGNENFITPFHLVAIMLPFGVLATMNVEFIRGLKKVHISEFFRNLELQLVNFTGLLLLSFYGLNYNHPVLFYGAGTLLAALFTSLAVYRYFNREKTKEDALKKTDEPTFVFRSHLIVSLPMILTSFIQFLNGRVDTLMYGAYSTTAELGVFTLAIKLAIITNFVISSLNTIATPKISELFWNKKMVELNKVVQSSARLIFIFALPVTLLLVIFPKVLLGLVGEEFESGYRALQIFALTQLVNSASGMVAVFLNMTGNQVFFTRLVAVATGLNIGLNLLFIPLMGMEGAALATLISSALWNIIGARFIYKKYKIRTYIDLAYLLKLKR
jgi:O-antigen/teichoic acid export membrane protein